MIEKQNKDQLSVWLVLSSSLSQIRRFQPLKFNKILLICYLTQHSPSYTFIPWHILTFRQYGHNIVISILGYIEAGNAKHSCTTSKDCARNKLKNIAWCIHNFCKYVKQNIYSWTAEVWIGQNVKQSVHGLIKGLRMQFTEA
jgi:hypothetical protein